MCVADDNIQIAPLDCLLQEPERVARHADEARFAFFFQLLEHVVGLVEDVLVVVGEFDVVGE